MTYLAAVLYIISNTFIWFFLGDLAFKVDPKDAIIVFSLLITSHITKRIIMLKEQK